MSSIQHLLSQIISINNYLNNPLSYLFASSKKGNFCYGKLCQQQYILLQLEIIKIEFLKKLWILYSKIGRIAECSSFCDLSYGVLICTLLSENQGLEKLRSVLNLRKISGPAHLDFFFQFVTWIFFKVYGINLAFFLGGDLEKNPGLQGLKFF